MSKEQLKSLLKIIEDKSGKSYADVSLEMKYKKNYISEMLTPKGKVTEKFIERLKDKYSDLLDNPNKKHSFGNDSEVNESDHPYGKTITITMDLEEHLSRQLEITTAPVL